MPLTFARRLWSHRELILRLSQRDILLRYRGSLLGWSWTLLNPLAMLAIYTFVFSTIFKASWDTDADLGSAGLALNIFSGMVVFGLFAECSTRAPTLITSNSSYVTKVRFPLETLACSSMFSALFHASTSLAILALFRVLLIGSIPWNALLLPMVWLPFLLLTLAATWLLSALGVYLRDLNQIVVIATSGLTFLSAVFYPLSALPKSLVPIFRLNPVACWVEQTRDLLIKNELPSAINYATSILAAIIFCELSLRLFRKASQGFADVL